jgi:predicted transcriptional regulator
MARKPTDTAHLNLRYPEALRRRLERAARTNDRSLNTEIVHRLEQSFRLEDFRERQDAINEGLLEIIHAVEKVVRRIPPIPQHLRLSDLARYLPDSPEDTSEQPATDKRKDSK